MSEPETLPVHIPVMAREVLDILEPAAGCRYLDATLGLGGHARAILNAAPTCEICGLDRDGEALDIARQNLSAFGNRVHYFHLPFSGFAEALSELGWKGVDGALADLGVSSLQLDKAERGFSFRNDGPLDMRMSHDGNVSAYEIVNRCPQGELAECIASLGEDPLAGRIARKIVEARQKRKIESTAELGDIIRSAYPPAWRHTARNHPATRAFQALRMKVNDETGQLGRFLDSILQWLLPGGKLVIISFHSIEDRIVKRAMRDWALAARKNSDFPEVRILYKKPLRPSKEEIELNPRATSAKLRAIMKLSRHA